MKCKMSEPEVSISLSDDERRKLLKTKDLQPFLRNIVIKKELILACESTIYYHIACI